MGAPRPVLLLAIVAALGACAKGGVSGADASIDAPRPIDAAIDSNNCSQQPCSILPQCGCTGANACDVDTSDGDGTACRNILTPGKETNTCTTNTTCDGGYVCVGGNAFASCKKYCETDAECGTPRGRCVIELTSGGAPIAGIPKVCTSNCEPTDTTAAGCPSTFKCTLYSQSSGGLTHKIADCSLAGTRTQGGDCTAGNGPNETMCAKGHQCVRFGNEATFKCRRICTNPTATSAQCGGQQCVGFTEPHTIGTTTYGVCAP
jgi:hypothetical protein